MLAAVPLVLTLLAGTPSSPAPATKGQPLKERVFTVRYAATVGPVPAGQGPLDVFLPLPPSDETQQVLSLEVHGPVKGERGREETFGNSYWHGRVESPDGKPVEVEVVATVRRKQVRGPLGAKGPQAYTPEEKERYARYLRAEKRVPLKGGPIEPIHQEIGEQLGPRAEDPRAVARALYDYVVDHLEYKKVGTGWGNGDTFWACSAKYGNCTDFHALFISLARRRGIPSNFEMGFPVPADKPSGQVQGYHCWVNFYLPGRGWVPIDASEADKHPEQRELLFGTQPADRLKLSEGRDLRLGEHHRDDSLNYFVYPYAELNGKRFERVAWRFDYAEGKQAPPKVAVPPAEAKQ
jgi:transglutaminase-like putative cysteine protease